MGSVTMDTFMLAAKLGAAVLEFAADAAPLVAKLWQALGN